AQGRRRGAAALDQLRVKLVARGALLELLVGALQLLVDDPLEGLDGLRAGDEAAVDEEARGAPRAARGVERLLLLDPLAVLAGVERLAELLHVQAELLDPLLEVLPGEVPEVREHLVVLLP